MIKYTDAECRRKITEAITMKRGARTPFQEKVAKEQLAYWRRQLRLKPKNRAVKY